jgi:hypothetical protein
MIFGKFHRAKKTKSFISFVPEYFDRRDIEALLDMEFVTIDSDGNRVYLYTIEA